MPLTEAEAVQLGEMNIGGGGDFHLHLTIWEGTLHSEQPAHLHSLPPLVPHSLGARTSGSHSWAENHSPILKVMYQISGPHRTLATIRRHRRTESKMCRVLPLLDACIALSMYFSPLVNETNRITLCERLFLPLRANSGCLFIFTFVV